jgi:hypothetical protein
MMYEVDRQCRAAFLVELETIIQLQLIITQLAFTQKNQQQKWLMKFIGEKKIELYVMSIHIDVPKSGTINDRFSAIVEQIQ